MFIQEKLVILSTKGRLAGSNLRMAESVNIGKCVVGEGKPVFIIAEISANHGQDFDKAVELVRKAKECCADAVKFQAYTPDTLTIKNIFA